MRWIRYEANDQTVYGIVEDDMVTEMGGDPFAGYEKTATRQPSSSVKLLVPVIPKTVADPNRADMVRIPRGTFRMGSNRHYPEEAPVHLAKVDAFKIDRTPVTNRQFAEFVRATGYVTLAETVPDPKDYPGSLAHLIFAGSLVFTPPKQ